MKILKRTSSYVVNHTKRQAIKELENDQRINKITSSPNKLIVVTNPIIPKGFKGDELFIYPVAVFKVVIKLPARQLSGAIRITPRTHPHIYSSSTCWGGFKYELLEMKKHKDWYWIVKRVLDFLNDFGPEDRRAPRYFSSEWVDRRLNWQLNYMEDDPEVKKKLKALNEIYKKKYKIKGFSEFR